MTWALFGLLIRIHCSYAPNPQNDRVCATAASNTETRCYWVRTRSMFCNSLMMFVVVSKLGKTD